MLRGGDVRKREALVDLDVGRLLVDQRFFGEFDVGCCWWRRGECGEYRDWLIGCDITQWLEDLLGRRFRLDFRRRGRYEREREPLVNRQLRQILDRRDLGNRFGFKQIHGFVNGDGLEWFKRRFWRRFRLRRWNKRDVGKSESRIDWRDERLFLGNRLRFDIRRFSHGRRLKRTEHIHRFVGGNALQRRVRWLRSNGLRLRFGGRDVCEREPCIDVDRSRFIDYYFVHRGEHVGR